MVIDHIGVVVRNLPDAIEEWERLFGYRKSTEVVENKRQRVRVVFLSKPASVIVKLVEATAPDSPIYQAARRGGGLHHLCFRCSALESEIRTLQQHGVRLLVPPEPGEAFQNHRIAFMLAGGNVNFELIDTAQKTGWHASILNRPIGSASS